MFQFYKLAVKACDDGLNPARPCVKESQLQAYIREEAAFSFNFYFVNTILNGEEREFRSLYLEDMNYFPFTNTNGVNANLFITSYSVSTDESIYPVQDIQTVTGGIVTSLAQMHNYQVQSDEYLKFYLRKSSQDIEVERSFRKVDETLSYIGGLFSAILGILIMVNFFNEFSYELEVARSVYQFEKDDPVDSDTFNFPVYIGYLFYNGFDKLGVGLPWVRMEKYHRALKAVRK